MNEYLELVADTLATGNYKENRTAIDTISAFSQQYTIDLQQGFPLLTTKNMSGYRWESLIHELTWYLSGEEHIRTLRENTKIWDAWADDNGDLDTAYGRFWRRYPIPGKSEQLNGETWANVTEGRWEDDDTIDPEKWLNEETHEWGGGQTFDQLQYVLDMLNKNPHSRRLVINAWHPANAAVSTLPPCHFTYVLNVQGDQLNCHLTQRSGDIALGIPFNIAAYSILTKLLAKQTGYNVGKFSHTIVDAHIYCGSDKRGKWYKQHLPELQAKLQEIQSKEIVAEQKRKEYGKVKNWLEEEIPTTESAKENKDHVTGLLEQLTRKPRKRPKLMIKDNSTINNIQYDDITLQNYNPHKGLEFGVAE